MLIHDKMTKISLIASFQKSKFLIFLKMVCPYHHYYSAQAGSGICIIYKGAPYQRGHGIASF